MNEAAFTRLREYAMSVFKCEANSIHGPEHWRKVEDSIVLIANETGADIVVGRLFAICATTATL